MPYLFVSDFRGGVDRSRPRYAQVPGMLYEGINGHISRGGDFEKRKAFVSTYSLPAAQTFGLAKTAAGLYVFGSIAQASLTPALPAGVNYQRLVHPSAYAMSAVNSVDLYNGKLYVIATFSNGDRLHFYDGSQVTDWNAGGTKPTGYGSIVHTHGRKVYSPVTSVLYFSGADTATGWDSTGNPGAGYQNMSNQQSGSDTVTALSGYQEQLAVFSRRAVQIWSMQVDAANNAPTQTVFETGTRSPKSAIGFGDLDAFYLSDSGVRSLRARNVTNTAGVNDVGTPIDTLIREYAATLSDATITAACAVVEPLDGRFWLALGEKIFVFTYFPSKKISAWTWYEPGVTFTDFANVNDRVYGRSGDTIYLYGGSDNATYDSSVATCSMPFLTGGKPAHFKGWTGFDMYASGTWTVTACIDPNEANNIVTIGDLTDVTVTGGNTSITGTTAMIAPKMVNSSSGYASISAIALHYDGVEAE